MIRSANCYLNVHLEKNDTMSGGFIAVNKWNVNGWKAPSVICSLHIECLSPFWLQLNHTFQNQPCRHQCSGHGICKTTQQNGFVCNCTRGFVGEKCEVSLSACDLAESEGTSCMSGGLCQNGSGTFEYQCFCTDGWTGVHCEKYVSNNVSPTNFVFYFSSD